MKQKRWIIGFIAALLLTTLPLSSVLAVGTAGEDDEIPSQLVAQTQQEGIDPEKSFEKKFTLKVEKINEDGTAQLLTETGAVYGDILRLTAEVNIPEGDEFSIDHAEVCFTVPGRKKNPVKLGTAELQEGQAVLEYNTADKKIPIGTTQIRARIMTEEKLPIPVKTDPVKVTLKKKPITITAITAVDKVYDGTTVAELESVTFEGLLEQDQLKNDDYIAEASFAQVNASAENTVTLEKFTLNDTPIARNYSLAEQEILPAAKAAIIPAPITVTAMTVENKIYDGTTQATVTGLELNGLVNQETLEMGVDYQPTAMFADANAANEKTVTLTKFEMKKTAKVANYQYSEPEVSLIAQADIQKADLTAAAILPQEKTYDGSTAATLKEVTFNGLKNNELLTAEDYTYQAVFADEKVGCDKVVTLTDLALDENGAAAQNYTLTYDPAVPVTATGTIEPKALTDEMVGWVDETTPLIYDGTAKNPSVNVSETLTEADYTMTWGDNILAGTGTVVVTAKENGNYTGSIARSFTIHKGGTAVAPSLERKFLKNQETQLRFVGRFVKSGDAAAYPVGTVTVKMEDGTTASGTLQADGSVEIILPDQNDKTECRFKVFYEGDENYSPMESIWITAQLKPIPKSEEKPKEEKTAPKEFDWYPALSSINGIQKGKLTIDVGREIAVPHYIWQAFYGKDITLTVQRGSEKFVFNGLDLKATGFDPDNGHNLTDLTGYIGRSYEKPQPRPEEKTEEKPKETETPEEKPETTPEPKKEEPEPEASQSTETQTPETKPEETHQKNTMGWLGWVIGIAALMAVIMMVVQIVLRRRSKSKIN